jgi:hypothetical protein
MSKYAGAAVGLRTRATSQGAAAAALNLENLALGDG